jgi:adenine-specific DNA-methyltransferase
LAVYGLTLTHILGVWRLYRVVVNSIVGIFEPPSDRAWSGASGKIPGMSEPVIPSLVAWAATAPSTPLSADHVPGADEDERRALAALGGLARGLVGEPGPSWPEEVQAWIAAGPDAPKPLLYDVWTALRGGTDVLAGCYEQIVSGRNRRRLGTFFTPPAVVDFMLQRTEAVVGTPSTVIDPGAGVGAFTVAARKRWPTATVIAVDLNVVTLGLLAARCRAERLEGITLVLDDYLSWTTNNYDTLSSPRLALGNPPYTRHHELPAKVKQSALQAAGELVSSSLAGLSTYFLATTLNALRPEDSLCFLLPGSWTETRYGREVREALWHARQRQIEFSAFPPTLDLFPGTRVTAMVLLVGPERDDGQPAAASTATLNDGVVQIGSSRTRSRRGPPPATLGTWLWPRRHPGRIDWVQLGEFAHVRRGVATGANSFFFLTDAARVNLPDGVTVPALVRLRHVPGVVLDARCHDAIGSQGLPRWLLTLDDNELLSNERTVALLNEGREQGVHLRHLTSLRDQWYQVETVAPPDVFIAPMSKGQLRAVRNEVEATPSNSIYGIYLDDTALATPLTSYLNSLNGQRALKLQGRHYGRSLLKLEPRNLLAVHTPHPSFLLENFNRPES